MCRCHVSLAVGTQISFTFVTVVVYGLIHHWTFMAVFEGAIIEERDKYSKSPKLAGLLVHILSFASVHSSALALFIHLFMSLKIDTANGILAHLLMCSVAYRIDISHWFSIFTLTVQFYKWTTLWRNSIHMRWRKCFILAVLYELLLLLIKI